MGFDYAAFKAEFRRRAHSRGIDPVEGANDYQARMLQLQASGRWSVEGRGRLHFYTPAKEEPIAKNVALSLRWIKPEDSDVLVFDGATLRELYAEVKEEWERERRQNRTLKQINEHRRAFEDAREAAIRGDLTRV